MEYTLRVVVEKVCVSTQEVVQRDTLKTYDVKPPESILELGLRHAEQISLLGKVQDAILAVQAKLGLDHGVGHSLLLLYDAKAPLGKKNNEFNSL
jgi:hypothetical protein